MALSGWVGLHARHAESWECPFLGKVPTAFLINLRQSSKSAVQIHSRVFPMTEGVFPVDSLWVNGEVASSGNFYFNMMETRVSTPVVQPVPSSVSVADRRRDKVKYSDGLNHQLAPNE